MRRLVRVRVIAAIENRESKIVGEPEIGKLVLAQLLVFGNGFLHVRLAAVASSHGIVFKQDRQIGLRGVIVGIELDGGAIRVGRARQIAPCAQFAAHQVVFQDLREHALGQR